MARTVLGVACAAFTATLAALILGEYEFRGMLPFVAGPLFGLILGEVVVGVGRSRVAWAGGLTALFAFVAIVWAGWINSGGSLKWSGGVPHSHLLEPIHRMIWAAAALAAITAYARITGLGRSSARPATSSATE